MPGFVTEDPVKGRKISGSKQKVDGRGQRTLPPKTGGQRRAGNVLGRPVSFPEKTALRMWFKAQSLHECLNIRGINHVKNDEKLFFVRIEKIYSFTPFIVRLCHPDRYRLPDV
jgi:hypothetical protein